MKGRRLFSRNGHQQQLCLKEGIEQFGDHEEEYIQYKRRREQDNENTIYCFFHTLYNIISKRKI